MGETGGNGGGWFGGELVVEIDCLGVAPGLTVEVGEGELGERGELVVPTSGHLLQRALGGGIVAGFNIGEAAEVAGGLAVGGDAVFIGGGHEELIGGFGAVSDRSEGLDSRRNLLTGLGQRCLVLLHCRAEGHGGSLRTAVIDDEGADYENKDRQHDGAGNDDSAAVFAGPLEAVLRGVDELVVLESLLGLLIHLVGSSFLARGGRSALRELLRERRRGDLSLSV